VKLYFNFCRRRRLRRMIMAHETRIMKQASAVAAAAPRKKKRDGIDFPADVHNSHISRCMRRMGCLVRRPSGIYL
jgi:hypothetical protein